MIAVIILGQVVVPLGIHFLVNFGSLISSSVQLIVMKLCRFTEFSAINKSSYE